MQLPHTHYQHSISTSTFSHLLQILPDCQTRRAPLKSSSPPTVTTTPAEPRVPASWTCCPTHRSHLLRLWSPAASCVVTGAALKEGCVSAGVDAQRGR